ncbi:MAG TPA: HlyD family efflux transporter periplasmic adaptor subunit [Candidatus Polarisedimenticolia bacterium]|nr:HlyD family efflux transporter periplasmic adaptor subunit [Candidatus Polarisedimenticolia bacterium]
MSQFAGWQQPWPRFRPDLQVLRRLGTGARPTTYYVRDPQSMETFEFGEEGAFLCQQLDGRSGPDDLRARFEARFGEPLDRRDLDVFMDQLAHKGMLEGQKAAATPRTFAEYFDPEVFLPWFNIPLINGDRIIGGLARRVEWLFSWPVHVICGAVVFWGLALFVQHFLELMGLVSRSLSLNFFLLLAFTSCFLVQSPRLMLHGVMCKRFGRQVSEIGVAFMYYVLPVFYCDWTDAIFVTDKKKRFWGIAAGLYYQTVLWAVAVILWRLTLPGTAANAFWLNLAFATSLGLFLFNANPLVKMNAYLLLVNQVMVPRLRERALGAFGAWATFRRPSEVFTAREKRWFIIYGLLVFTYAMFHLGLIAYFFWGNLVPLYEGRGALAALLLLLFVMHKPILGAIAALPPIAWLLDRRGGWLRWSVRVAIPTALLAVLFLPYPYRTGGAFQFLPARRAEIRTEVEGVIEEVLVREGEQVAAGQPIARLGTRNHSRNLAAAKARLEGARARLSLVERGPRPEQVASAESKVASAAVEANWAAERAGRIERLHKDSLVSDQDYESALAAREYAAAELDESKATLVLATSRARPDAIRALRAEVDSLQTLVDDFETDVQRTTLTSPIAGRIVTPRIEEEVGTWLEPGTTDLVAVVEDTGTVLAEVSVPEQEVGDIRPGATVILAPWGFHDTPARGRVVAIAPIADPNPGSGEVANLSNSIGSVGLLGTESAATRVVRVLAEVPDSSGRLKIDMTGFAKIDVGQRPLWDVLFRPFWRWCRVEVWSWIP